ncbi:hypothetical protein [Candidatus Methylacidithermus pantelleriae]|uniref:Uncharacterized protein n=1 Tax=Candidatus Methylacidithermus pantelleriae TaxID=2744239 RepID=A0A8J2BPC2_9BACT|nr:hypothetical protein [Candidatus Methylacidithermus pantelleriae]CAF0698794.1 hypothetical protein MPNT_30021 [Candidatus Methylacidithermus pantelleriae]
MRWYDKAAGGYGEVGFFWDEAQSYVSGRNFPWQGRGIVPTVLTREMGDKKGILPRFEKDRRWWKLLGEKWESETVLEELLQ